MERYKIAYRNRELTAKGDVIGYGLVDSNGRQIKIPNYQLKPKIARHEIEVEGLTLNADAAFTDIYVNAIREKVLTFINKCRILGINVEEYKFSDDYCALLEYTGRGDNVKIPPVEAIGHHCFSYAGYETFNGPTKKNIKLVRVPKSVNDIGKSAFYDSRVEKVIIEGNIETIGSNAFAGCGHLKQIEFNGAVKQIGSGCFQNSRIERV